ncbi:MAG: H/ACA RNA-protein complex component Gar1 [Candidatus Methanofastidiosum methylothiophilum]|uniref:H/ACA RNA-protein complex component Gar1 n=1 Tax=Candidatus Methanofastidiosum methylothiophilum TaxID=1705564 RepID=A0A150IL02_9EURY|nr:MAG: H/ACA RNA-protein complex component Gar1 [Candidatus Methanofastidiosum methylthiophilus]KYC47750.1 MAG: H/ACA RNA-protein complex component Gar1 [Candidatus Methanofastidiosum methylthiophilus]KYC50521.1 MAG: H/ACA RNA-protein complex component Gar1 [Candidatus Methanofastidiosum methylthiophilus]
MKSLGRVMHSIGPLFILRSKKIKIRDIGAEAYIGDKKIGKIIELFGPVDDPYVKIVSRRDLKDRKSFVGKDVSIR